MQYFYESYYGRCDDLYWISFYDYFSRIGILHHDLFLELKELFKCGIFTSIMQEGICYISKPPIFLKRDSKGRMHNTSDYAICFNDGFGLHYVHGVYFSIEDFMKYVKNKPHAKEIMLIKNVEQKAALISLWGYEKIIGELDVKIIDNYSQRKNGKEIVSQLIEFPLSENMTMRALKLQDHSTDKIYIVGIPRSEEINTVKKALAWKFQVEEYEPLMES